MTKPLKISFTPSFLNYEGHLTPPEPAVKHVPEWYKSLAKHGRFNDDKKLQPVNNIGGDGANVATKMCLPFFDAITAGYFYLLEDDLLVELDEDGHPTLSWKNGVMILDKRPTIELVPPNETHPMHYGWRMNWFYETPPGYSVLITHPMNRFDLPFTTLSGIVESDIWGLPVFTAFFLNKGFQGVIPKGTPIMQFIPFKRDDWELHIEDSEADVERHEFKAENRRSLLYGYYKKTAWRRKLFGTKNKTEIVDHDE
jgi:hypothetical protein